MDRWCGFMDNHPVGHLVALRQASSQHRKYRCKEHRKTDPLLLGALAVAAPPSRLAHRFTVVVGRIPRGNVTYP